MTLRPYDRRAAVAYAHRWAYHRNPDFYNFDELGGDCTNFASQCLYAGSGVMNYTPTFGWYYNSQYNRAPAWTGVPFFYNFLTRKQESPGPVGRETGPEEVRPGDDGMSQIAVVRPEVDMHSLVQVFVVKDFDIVD